MCAEEIVGLKRKELVDWSYKQTQIVYQKVWVMAVRLGKRDKNTHKFFARIQ